MIGGATRGAGGHALGDHLAEVAGNKEVRELDGRGLIASGIRAQVAELTRLGAHARTRTPLYHVHADPPADRPWSDEERVRYWQAFEAEFGFQGRPFAAVGHLKEGRLHEHRVYLRIRDDGTAIRLDHDHARREKLHRLFELERGEALTPGAHNRAVLAALEREGRHGAVQAMRDAGLDAMERPRAATTPRQRAQAERTGADPKAIGAVVLAAWKASDGGAAFQAALAEHGLRLAQGDKAVLVVDATGNAHGLRRLLAAAAKAEGDRVIRQANVSTRLQGLVLAPHEPGASPREETRHARTDVTTPCLGSMVGVRSEGDPGRGERGEGGRRAHPDARPEGAVPGGLRRHEGRDDGRLLDAPPRPPGATGEGGTLQGRPHPPAAGADRTEPARARAAAGRDGVQARRVERALSERVDAARAERLRSLTWQLAAPVRQPVLHRTIKLCPGLETEDERRARRRRWIAAAMRQAYDVGWVPESVARNLRRVDVDEARGAVILTLFSGTRLVDRRDRIDVVGVIDDVTVDELVEAVRRRGWDAVEVKGAHGFRHAVALRMALLEPPVAVADVELSEIDQNVIRGVLEARHKRVEEYAGSSYLALRGEGAG